MGVAEIIALGKILTYGYITVSAILVGVIISEYIPLSWWFGEYPAWEEEDNDNIPNPNPIWIKILRIMNDPLLLLRILGRIIFFIWTYDPIWLISNLSYILIYDTIYNTITLYSPKGWIYLIYIFCCKLIKIFMGAS